VIDMISVFDVGGTTFRSARFAGGQLADVTRTDTPNYLRGLTEAEINAAIVDLIVRRVLRDKVDTVGVCYAGPVSAEGTVTASPVIHGGALRQPFALKDIIRRETGLERVFVTNDLTAAAMRYIRRYRRFLLLTVSSGVGGKIAVDGRIQIGLGGLEGEIGHIPAPDGGEVDIDCPCGTGKNHIGCVSSGRGIAMAALQLRHTLCKREYEQSSLFAKSEPSTRDIAAAADQNDAFAMRVIDYCTRPLAYALCVILSAMYLEKVILIGGLAQNCAYYVASLVRNTCGIGVYNYGEREIRDKFMTGDGDDDHGLIGVERFIREQLRASIA